MPVMPFPIGAKMRTILSLCEGLPRRHLDPGTVLLPEGASTGRLYVLGEGTVEVLRGDTVVATVSEPGAVFGEMAVLLDTPHTATVKAASPGWAYELADAGLFLRSHPEIAFEVAETLARRLNAATTYLADLKRQFAGHSNHLSMVGEVLESLIHRPSQAISPGSERRSDPRL
jgi:CRP-like cAMP-binding protein